MVAPTTTTTTTTITRGGQPPPQPAEEGRSPLKRRENLPSTPTTKAGRRLNLPPVDLSRLFVARYNSLVPETNEDEEDFALSLPAPTCSKQEAKRRLKWKELNYLYLCMRREQERGRFCSVERAMWVATHGTITARQFVAAMMGEFRYGAREGLDNHLHRLYRGFDGSDEDKVDVREVMASFSIIIQHSIIRCNIGKLLLQLYDMFCSHEPPYHLISRKDLIKIFTLPVVSDEEAWTMSHVIDTTIPPRKRISRAAFLTLLQAEVDTDSARENFGWLGGKEGGCDSSSASTTSTPPSNNPTEGHSTLSEIFQACSWRRLNPDLKLATLKKVEERCVRKFDGLIEVHQSRNAYRLRHKLLMRMVWRQWKAFTAFHLRITVCKGRILMRKAHYGLQRWVHHLDRLRWKRLKRIASVAVGDAHAKKRIILRLQQYRFRQQAERKYNRRHGKEFRMALDGWKYIRGVERVRSICLAFQQWKEEVWYMAALDAAQQHFNYQLLRRVMKALRQHVAWIVRLALEDKVRKEALRKIEMEMEEARRKVEEARRKKEEEDAKREAEERANRARERFWEGMRRKAEHDADQRLIQSLQAEEQANRTKWSKFMLRRQFDIDFQRRLEMIMDEKKAEVDTYFDENHMPTGINIDMVQKEYKFLHEHFFEPPKVGNEDKELNVKDPANIVFVIIEALLNQTGDNLRALFDRYDTDGSGAMSHSEFLYFMQSLDLPWLTREKIRDIIRKVDSDGDGQVEWQELESAMENATNKLGVPGSCWKMYVDPAQDVMVYHNINTNEKVFDFKMTDERLYEVLHENLRAAEARKAYDDLKERKPQEWQKAVHGYAATVIQRLARARLARKKRRGEYWQWAMVVKDRREEDETRAIQIIRRLFEAKLARRQLRYLASINFERVLDHRIHKYYYYNHASGVSHWVRPTAFLGPNNTGQEEEDDLVPWSTSFHMGKPIYLNGLTGEVMDTKPEGFAVCGRCNTLLAVKRCVGCSNWNLCFGCFRAVHMAMPTIRASRGDHDGIGCGQVLCTKCPHKTPADRHCHGCGTDLCKACFARIHRSPVLGLHSWSKI